MGERSIVYVVAKAPQPSTCKTRLCPPLSTEEAVGLARAFLLDAIEIVERAGADVRVMCRTNAERTLLLDLVNGELPVSVQQGRGLGSALQSAFTEGLEAGYTAVGVFGADSPTLDPHTLRTAFAALEDGADIALGPSEDGGYYLLVADAVYPHLFHRMPWSTSRVAQLTLDRSEALGLTMRLLPTWYDVDDWAGLMQLREEIMMDRPDIARHTRQELARAGLDAIPSLPDPMIEAQLVPHGAA